MVKLAKGAKAQGKPKKAPPPMEVEDSEDEEMEESEEEMMEVPVKTKAKATTPAKAGPGKKAATPAKSAVTPGKKGATPAGAKNGKKAKKEESEDEEESEEESEEEEKPAAKKPTAKKPVAKKEDSEEEDDDDDEDDDDEEDEEESEEEQKPAAKKPIAKKIAAKTASKESDEDDDDDDDEEVMEVVPPVAKGKKAVAKKEESEEEDDDDEEDDEEEEEDDDDDEDEEDATKESGKRKKEMAKNKAAPEQKKLKTEGTEGLSIFVANLNSAKDYDELKDSLREFFSKKSLPVQDVRIGSSKKFGYVDFSSAEEVEKALTLSGKKVLGFEIKIDKANTPAEKAKNAENKKERDSRTLFVKNLPYSTGVEQLQEIFENAKEVRVPLGKEGSSKGIAYVEFNTEAEADEAIQDKQGTEIEGRSMFIDYTGEKSQKGLNAGGRRAGSGGDAKVLVVNNLAYSATEDSLQEVFEKAVSIRIPQNNNGKPKGFAFVEFSSVEEAKDALESLNNTEIEGRSIRIEVSQGSGFQGGRGATQSKTLFVKGLSEDTTEETLKEAFDGSLNARIVTDRDTGTSKGFGFVDFSTAEDAKAAKEAMEDGEIDGNKVTLDFAKPKGDGQRGGRGGFGGRGGGRGGFGGRGGGRGGFGGRGGGRGGFGGRGGGRGGFGGRGGGRGGFGGRGGGGFRGGNQGQGKKIKFDN